MTVKKDRLRRTMMFIPGNNPSMMSDAHIYGPDAIMFDLEDSVKLSEKDAARFLVYNALKTIDYGDVEKVVRVNPLDTPFGKADIEAMVKAGADIIRLPKSETAEDVKAVDALISEFEEKHGIEKGSVGMMAAIESGLGIIHAYAIATASPRLIGMAIGAEDFVTDLKTSRSPDGIELITARSMLLFAARAAGIAALDTVYSDVNNEEGFRKEVELIKQLGFDGKSVINPRQIAPVVEIFTPTPQEIEHAENVLEAIQEAEEKGLGVISLNGKMVDKPVVERALRTLKLAEAAGSYRRS
ncbi:citrate (pro-3S)-lyase subunit beta [Geosporobacter ferrireducens]|uniref:citrate (pro-3S)-lyase subunit beta n=1 Tax=Geosporobacter ferrireducens TaxID=1424294 RepID=UPI00139DD331|nr:citrate (pro-3S)-lyase subunit beta [Geosporobacter ferrireducens]MTI54699.1 citrate (pro-3S)-lyase subunit beta [Geosporobacter ferrireducens]